MGMRIDILTCVVVMGTAFATGFSLIRAAGAPLPPGESAPGGPIESVLVREKDVLATDGLSLYRATLADRKWHAVPTPADVPLGGKFVVPPAEQIGSDTVLFCATAPEMALVIDDPKTGATRLVTGDAARGKERYGLYRSVDGGTSWKLLSDAQDYQFVFWHPDNTLYALAGKKGFVNPTHIYRSKDSGGTWEDISHGLDSAGYGGLVSIFQDPDHPALVCVGAQGVRGYVLHADDDSYQWHGEQETEWDRSHPTDEKFLATNYSFGGIDSISDYLFPASFGNYFSHPFGRRTEIDAFESKTEKSEYTFAQDGPKPVRVTLRFRPTDHPAISYDLAGATDFWGVRMIDPGGKRTTIVPKVQQHPGKDDATVQKEYEQRKEIVHVHLTSAHSYTREVDLDKLVPFPLPGVYRVQLVYNSPWWAVEGRAHWTGEFGGNVMTITIK